MHIYNASIVESTDYRVFVVTYKLGQLAIRFQSSQQLIEHLNANTNIYYSPLTWKIFPALTQIGGSLPPSTRTWKALRLCDESLSHLA